MISIPTFSLIKSRIASKPLSASTRQLFSSSFTSHPTAMIFKRPLSLLSFASGPSVYRSSQWNTLILKDQVRQYHQDLLDSSASSLPTPVSQNDAARRRLRLEIVGLLQGSRVLERQIGNIDPPDPLNQFGHISLLAIKSSILAARESDGQNWEHALYQALTRAVEYRMEVGKSKRGELGST